MKCRHCQSELKLPFLDLGSAPPSNAFLSAQALNQPEVWYPLRLLVCETCWLVQTEDFAGREAFFNDDYAYFSSFSSSWLAHAKHYVQTMRQRFELNANSRVIEVASNDGYLLQYVQELGIPCLGVEPTRSTAAAARAKGIAVQERFFGVEFAEELLAAGTQADLMVANNVLAHVPDINDFVRGFALVLKPQGVATFEFPHLLKMVSECQFDTAYHEHFSYLSLSTVRRILKANGLTVFDVESLPTHGGSLRVFAQRSDTGVRPVLPSVDQIVTEELTAGMDTTAFYAGFQAQAVRIARELNAFLIASAQRGERVVAYGAAAKGNTLLNFAGVRSHLLPYVVDLNPSKQGQFLPGSRIPIKAPDCLETDNPTAILVLPWNLKHEVSRQLDAVRRRGIKLLVAIPHVQEIAIGV